MLERCRAWAKGGVVTHDKGSVLFCCLCYVLANQGMHTEGIFSNKAGWSSWESRCTVKNLFGIESGESLALRDPPPQRQIGKVARTDHDIPRSPKISFSLEASYNSGDKLGSVGRAEVSVMQGPQVVHHPGQLRASAQLACLPRA